MTPSRLLIRGFGVQVPGGAPTFSGRSPSREGAQSRLCVQPEEPQPDSGSLTYLRADACRGAGMGWSGDQGVMFHTRQTSTYTTSHFARLWRNLPYRAGLGPKRNGPPRRSKMTHHIADPNYTSHYRRTVATYDATTHPPQEHPLLHREPL